MTSLDLFSPYYYSPTKWGIAVARVTLPFLKHDRALLEIENVNGFVYVCIGYVVVCGGS